MYDINYKNFKAERFIYKIFIYIGIFILLILDGIVAVNIIRKNSFDSYVVTRHIEIESHEYDEGEIMYTPIYHYSVNEREYKCNVIVQDHSSKAVYMKSEDKDYCDQEFWEK